MSTNSDMIKGQILVADDQPVWAEAFSQMLRQRGFETTIVTEANNVVSSASRGRFDLVTLDLSWDNSQLDGFALLTELQRNDPALPVVMLTNSSEVRDVVKAIQIGAVDYIPKGFDRDKTVLIVTNAIEMGRLRRQNSSLLNELRDKYDIKGDSASIKSILASIQRFGPTESTVLVTGETGTGKMLVARQIHYNSKRWDKRFVRLDMNLTPRELADSMLFGHHRGSFSGAVEGRKGLVEEAKGGTLFLDEIADASLELQAKLKTLVDNKEFRRVGENEERPADVRIIAATNRDLVELIREGRFLEDLYYRLKVVELRLPPLRAHKEDIPVLASHFVKQESLQQLGYERTPSHDALTLLCDYEWPGNVRELRLMMQAAVVCSEPGTEITEQHIRNLPGSVFRSTPSSQGKLLKERMSEFLRVEVTLAMSESEGKVERAARQLGVDRTTLYRYLAELDLKHLIS